MNRTVGLKIRLKRTLGRLYARYPQPRQRRIVLLYHALGSSPFALEETAFRAQMEWLASVADIVPLSRLLVDSSLTSLQAAITFDDGYASLHTGALPVLRGACVSAFLNTGWIGTHARKASDPTLGHYPNESFLLWREVEDLAAAGWDIGSHGVDHLDLTQQPDGVVRAQLHESRARIEEVLSACSPVFSYTWGRHTPHLRRMVAEAGYTYAVAGVHGAVTAHSDPMAIPRIDIANTYTLDDFKAIVRGDWDYLAWLQRARAFG
jgi:peptidoglycan/xylan/chitin deacetylase (PgdA/CDA1 family)